MNHHILPYHFPFRIGCTSYTFPDDILPNVTAMAPLVDDIELILFETPTAATIPSKATIARLKELALQHALTYTVHLPADYYHDFSERSHSLSRFYDGIQRIADSVHELAPYAYIFHGEGITAAAHADMVSRWLDSLSEIVQKICVILGEPQKICIENLSYPWQWHYSVIEQLNLSVCIDIGHFWFNRNLHWIEDCSTLLPKTRVIHVHGFTEHKDHHSLKSCDPQLVNDLIKYVLAAYTGVVTCEVFTYSDFSQSAEMLACCHKNISHHSERNS